MRVSNNPQLPDNHEIYRGVISDGYSQYVGKPHENLTKTPSIIP